MNLSLRWWAFWSTVFGAPMVVFMLLLRNPDWDPSLGTNVFHFYIVSATALAAFLACGMIVGVTESLRETRLLFLGLAFMSIAAIFAVHGLSTPGHIHDEAYAGLKISSWLSVFVGAIFV